MNTHWQSRGLYYPGTLGMLLEASKMGANVQLEKIPKPNDIDWISWFKMYPGSGFVLTSPPDSSDDCVSLLNKYHIDASIVGKVTNDKKLTLSDVKLTKTVFDFNKDKIMGFSEC